jgi:hypothetical protein
MVEKGPPGRLHNRNRSNSPPSDAPGPSNCAIGAIFLQNFPPSAPVDVPVHLTLREAPQRPFPVPMPARRCPHCPGLRTLLSVWPIFHSKDSRRSRKSGKLSFQVPQRPAVARRRDRDAWRVGPRPRSAARRLRRSGFRDYRRGAQKTGPKTLPIVPTRAKLKAKTFFFLVLFICSDDLHAILLASAGAHRPETPADYDLTLPKSSPSAKSSD